jgi:hypothetical protein
LVFRIAVEHEQLDAYSIALFCVRHGISARGLGLALGARVL